MMASWDHNDLKDKRGERIVTEKLHVSSANERQVGGSHYETNGVQHWDLFGPEYLMGYATKYLRWRKKGGIEDLEKAIHVIEKLIEVISARAKPIIDQKLAEEWVTSYGLDWVERSIAHRILFYRDHGDLREAIEGIRHLIETHKSQPASNVIVVDHRIDLRPKSIPYDSQCTPEDGAQHASLSPWVVKEGWFFLHCNKNITTELKNTFFRQRAKMFTLEPYVESDQIPRQLARCYDLSFDLKTWVLRIENCPADAREYFPSLQRECNIVELEEKPLWQRALYEWNEDGNKYELASKFAAWHAETE